MSNIVEFRLPDRFENVADIEDIVTLSDLLCVMLAQPDADTASWECTASCRSSRIALTRYETA